MKVISIYGGHNATVVFNTNEKYHIVELERLMKQRYFMLFDKTPEEFTRIINLTLDIAKKYWGIENDFDICTYGVNGANHVNYIKNVINTKQIKQFNHHLSHAACAYYQSSRPVSSTYNFEKQPNDIIISFDGGGNDGVFNVYSANRKSINPNPIFSSNLNLGHAYMLTGYPISELKGQKGGLPHDLALAGKMMGLAAYGKIREEWISPMLRFYQSTGVWSLQYLGQEIGLSLGINTLQGQASFDFAATSQKVFEILALDLINKVVEKTKPDFVCLSGGCALNVLLNEKLAREYGWGDDFLFIPPNSDDGGLALGQQFLVTQPTSPVDVTFNGLPILDKDKFSFYISTRKNRKISFAEFAKYLKQGKIVGIIEGDSEVGPRALGNRSIVCDPSFENMKNILNAKVKFREWFRPFAPVALDDEANTFFVLNQKTLNNHRFMSFAPIVRDQYQNQLKSITHEDGSSRLQTVSKNENSVFSNLLNEFSKIDNKPAVLLNTSFNIKGLPILSTYEDAFKVLDETELDAVYTNGYLFE